MTPSEFQQQFPEGEFDALDPDYIQRFLDLAAPMFNVDRWTAAGHYSEGLACLVANNIVVSKARAARGIAQANAGNMTEKHVGPVGASFDAQILNMQAKDTLMLTDYGRRYCELRDMVGLGGVGGAG